MEWQLVNCWETEKVENVSVGKSDFKFGRLAWLKELHSGFRAFVGRETERLDPEIKNAISRRSRRWAIIFFKGVRVQL